MTDILDEQTIVIELDSTPVTVTGEIAFLDSSAAAPSAAVWGAITGTLSDQTDLNSALALKAPLASPALTGTPTAPTAATGTNTTQLATTAFVQTAVGSSGVAWGAITGTLSDQTDLNSALAAKAPLASPALTGTPTAPTAAAGTNTTQLATTAFVQTAVGAAGVAWGGITGTLADQADLNSALAAKAPLASPALTGTPTAPTAATGTNTTQLATTAFVQTAVGSGGVAWGGITGTLSDQTDLNSALALKAPLASPALTGTPTAPTAATGTNTTQLATTAFVQTAVGSGGVAWGGITGTLADQTDLNSALALKAPLASPALTGTPTAPTAAAGTNTTQLATTAFVQTAVGSGGVAWGGITGTLSDQTDLNSALAAKAPLASPALTGTPTCPTLSLMDNTTAIANASFVQGVVSGALARGVNDQTGTSYTVASTDQGKMIRCTNASAVALNIDTAANSGITSAGWAAKAMQGGAGTVTVTALTGVTLRTPNGAATAAQYDARAIEYLGSDEWLVW